MKQILIVGPAWVGDMIMAQSLFQALKQQQPDIAIDVLAPDWSRPLLQRMPEVRSAISLAIKHGIMKLKTRFDIANQLKLQKYDQAIILPNSWKSALIPWLAKIPKRTGWLGEMRWGLLNDIRKLDEKALPRMVDRFTLLAYPNGTSTQLIREQMLPPKLQSSAENIEKVLEKFNLKQNLPQPILVLCPGAEFGASKRWPEVYFSVLANVKIKEGWQVWLLGSKNDQPVAHNIQAMTQDHCIDLTGKTTLSEAIDLIAAATAVVSNDSGLMHIAAAQNKPLVAIYGSTDPNFTPPLHHKANIIKNTEITCSPCFKRECPLKHHACMEKLQPAQVLNSLQSLGQSCGF